jgi:hypothetical protein
MKVKHRLIGMHDHDRINVVLSVFGARCVLPKRVLKSPGPGGRGRPA